MPDADIQALLNNSSFRILHGSGRYIIGHIYEETFLLDLSQKQSLPLADFYGDPTCALVDLENRWCLVAGDNLLLWTPEQQILIEDKAMQYIHDIRQTGPWQAHLLIDPWADHAAIWELDIQTLKRRKISNFTAYKHKPYTDYIEW